MLWGNTDASSNTPKFTVSATGKVTANDVTGDVAYDNTTPGAIVSGQVFGLFGVTAEEMTSLRGVSSIATANAGGGFTSRPTVTLDAPPSPGVAATATAVALLVAATTSVRGAGYVPGDNLDVTGGTSTATAVINVTSTAVATMVPHTGALGSGFANGDVITLRTGTGTSANATVTTGAANSSVASLTLINRGNYTVNPTLTAAATTNATGSGTGLTVDVTMGIANLAVLIPGSYTVLPTLANNAVSGGTGTNANVDLSFGMGAVTVTNTGSYYTSIPAATIGGGGTGAEATVSMIASSNGEQQYVAAPGWTLRRLGMGPVTAFSYTGTAVNYANNAQFNVTDGTRTSWGYVATTNSTGGALTLAIANTQLHANTSSLTFSGLANSIIDFNISGGGGSGYANTDFVLASNGVLDGRGTITTNTTGGITAVVIGTGNGGAGFTANTDVVISIKAANGSVSNGTSAVVVVNAISTGSGATLAATLGGRSGRIHYETLVELGSLGGTTGNSTIFPQ